MSSPQTPVSSSKKPTTIIDLHPELITSIYKHLDKPSSITALNSTSHRHYLIWQSNAASISSTVIYDKIPSFSTTLELLHTQEKIRGIDFTTKPSAHQSSSRDPTRGSRRGAERSKGRLSRFLLERQGPPFNSRPEQSAHFQREKAQPRRQTA